MGRSVSLGEPFAVCWTLWAVLRCITKLASAWPILTLSRVVISDSKASALEIAVGELIGIRRSVGYRSVVHNSSVVGSIVNISSPQFDVNAKKYVCEAWCGAEQGMALCERKSAV
ncbi:hypothetical protein PENSPDRAFT_649189 [Peniophora sp. CONT]|nr:hypothetical protein PENSPDRAFT_649189 [Peniophora sp. CONT]